MLRMKLKFQKHTGDGACAYNAVSGHLFEAIIRGTAPIEKRATEYAEFLSCFADFHPNFNPATLENLKRWLTHYVRSMRDVELLLSPVLMHWYNMKERNVSKAESLAVLPYTFSQFSSGEVIVWLCENLGFNLSLRNRYYVETFFDTDLHPGFKPGPFVYVRGNDSNTHFDSTLDARIVDRFEKKTQSKILAHHKDNLFSAYSALANPLLDPAQSQSDGFDILTEEEREDRILYNRLRVLQRELQIKAMRIDELEGREYDPFSGVYGFSFAEDFQDMPDRATLLVMTQFLRDNNTKLSEELHEKTYGFSRRNPKRLESRTSECLASTRQDGDDGQIAKLTGF